MRLPSIAASNLFRSRCRFRSPSVDSLLSRSHLPACSPARVPASVRRHGLPDAAGHHQPWRPHVATGARRAQRSRTKKGQHTNIHENEHHRAFLASFLVLFSPYPCPSRTKVVLGPVFAPSLAFCRRLSLFHSFRCRRRSSTGHRTPDVSGGHRSRRHPSLSLPLQLDIAPRL